jgi:hypothetical protein
MGPSGQGWEHGEEFFGYLFYSLQKKGGMGLSKEEVRLKGWKLRIVDNSASVFVRYLSCLCRYPWKV